MSYKVVLEVRDDGGLYDREGLLIYSGYNTINSTPFDSSTTDTISQDNYDYVTGLYTLGMTVEDIIKLKGAKVL